MNEQARVQSASEESLLRVLERLRISREAVACVERQVGLMRYYGLDQPVGTENRNQAS